MLRPTFVRMAGERDHLGRLFLEDSMRFEDAMKVLKNGGRVRLPTMPPDCRVRQNGDKVTVERQAEDGTWVHHGDLFRGFGKQRTDWELAS